MSIGAFYLGMNAERESVQVSDVFKVIALLFKTSFCKQFCPFFYQFERNGQSGVYLNVIHVCV